MVEPEPIVCMVAKAMIVSEAGGKMTSSMEIKAMIRYRVILVTIVLLEEMETIFYMVIPVRTS